MAKRVKKWETRLQPILEEQNERSHYNMDDYRQKVMEAVQEVTVTDGRKKEVKQAEFADVTREMDKYDVCRYFLASLHLANEGRLMIDRRPEDDVMMVRPIL